MPNTTLPNRGKSRLYEIELDRGTIRHLSEHVEHEREVAVFDILEDNSFALPGCNNGPYKLTLSIVESRLVFNIGNEQTDTLITHVLSLTPFRRVVKQYFEVCETYYEAIKTAPPSRIQAIDMGRRGLHDEGSLILIDRLDGKIEVDKDTARRLFTLICALHWKG